jgi:hypothetical protein
MRTNRHRNDFHVLFTTARLKRSELYFQRRLRIPGDRSGRGRLEANTVVPLIAVPLSKHRSPGACTVAFSVGMTFCVYAAAHIEPIAQWTIE